MVLWALPRLMHIPWHAQRRAQAAAREAAVPVPGPEPAIKPMQGPAASAPGPMRPVPAEQALSTQVGISHLG